MRLAAVGTGLWLSATVFALAAPSDRTPPAAGSSAGVIDFARDVRPILSQHCYGCHGPDEAKRRAKLRLDVRAEALADRDGDPVIVPSDTEMSLLVERIFDDEDPMPPEGKGEPLTDVQKQTLVRWIEQGASWPTHWAFDPPRAAPPPAPRSPERAEWVRDPVDAFVLAKLEAAGLSPAAEATREAWIRRASFDLTGLPPTLEELDTFLTDTRGDAFERQVDRLLASPRYGERQAQDWLDLARYADTNGNQFDEPRTIWKWRDWVIGAFNENMPFDRFTIEQLAGDLLPGPTIDQLVATGFNRNHPTDTDGPSEMNEYRSEYVIDRVHTTATAWMGLTMACAQCHDHKFDPITQRDFYSFYAFFDQIDERDIDQHASPRPRIHVPNPDQKPLYDDLAARIDVLEERLEADDPLLDAAQAKWEEETRAALGEPIAWEVLDPVGMLSQSGARLTREEDGSIRSSGPTPVKDTVELVVRPGRKRIEALRLEVLPDEDAPLGATGRGGDGRFFLNALEVRVSSISESRDPPLLRFAKAEADRTQERVEDADEWTPQPGDIASAIVVEAAGGDGGGGGDFRGGRGGWSFVGDEKTAAHEAVLLPLSPIELNDASVVRVTMRQGQGRPARGLISRFRWSVTDDPRVRRLLLPTTAHLWSSLGPFPATDAAQAFATELPPEPDIAKGIDLNRRYTPPAPPKKESPEQGMKKGAKKATAKAEGPATDPAKAEAARAPDEDGAKPEAKEGEAVVKAEDAAEDAAPPAPTNERRRAPRKLEWKARREWKDGARQRLDGAGAWFLTRKITCDRPTTAVVRLDGPAGVRVWLNGEEVFAEAPKPAATPAPKASDDESEGFSFFRRRSDDPVRTVRLGFRAGENELVVKAVFSAPPARKARGGEGGGGDGGGFGRSRSSGASITFDFTPQGDGALTHEVATELCAPEGVTHAKVVRDHFRRRVSPVGRALAGELARLEKEKKALERKLPSTMVMKEREEPRPTHVFVRGDFRRLGDEVSATTPAALPSMPADLPRNRLGLARWLVSPDHPLTARVAVNRLWQQLFGSGLVGTPDDFGIRSPLPSHPALLDTLAVDFVASGWDVKALQRRLVLSATYRQSSVATPEKREVDPENRLLSRGPRVRLSAEMVRDQALAISGLLVEKVGGKSVKPYQAPGLWTEVTGGRDYKKDDGPDQYRRGVYVYRKRRVPYASMSTFDAATPDTCAVRRSVTNTPLQALVLLNNPVYVEAARVFATRLLGEPRQDDEGRLAYGFRCVTSRNPSPEERAVLTRLLEEQRAAYAEDEKAAKALVKIGDAPVDEKLDVKALATWTAVASALLNLDAALHKG